MGQDEISNSICALNGLGVVVEGVQKPGVLGSDQLPRFGISPHLGGRTCQLSTVFHKGFLGTKSTNLVFIVFVQIHTTSLRFPPYFRHTLIHIGLVYYLGNDLGHFVDQRRIWGRYLSAVDCVCGAIFDEKGEKSVNAVNKPDDDQGVDDEEDGETVAHRGWLRGVLRE